MDGELRKWYDTERPLRWQCAGQKIIGAKDTNSAPGNKMLGMEEGDDYDCHWINKEQLHMCVYLHLKMHTIYNFENENHWALKSNIYEMRMPHLLTKKVTFSTLKLYLALIAFQSPFKRFSETEFWIKQLLVIRFR